MTTRKTIALTIRTFVGKVMFLLLNMLSRLVITFLPRVNSFSVPNDALTDVDYSPEFKRCLLLERKVLTNLDSILKSRDITLLKKVHIGKAMVFPVVMCGCESWTIKKTECRRTDALEPW